MFASKLLNKLIAIVLGWVVIGSVWTVYVNYVGDIIRCGPNIGKGDIANYSTQIIRYAIDHDGAYPKTLQELVPRYIKAVKSDPWGNAYVYVQPLNKDVENIEIYSLGPDGRAKTADDVTSRSGAMEPAAWSRSR